ncbi:MAG: hypothetical protein ACJ71B_13105 [Nitrososphaera sp.]
MSKRHAFPSNSLTGPGTTCTRLAHRRKQQPSRQQDEELYGKLDYPPDEDDGENAEQKEDDDDKDNEKNSYGGT